MSSTRSHSTQATATTDAAAQERLNPQEDCMTPNPAIETVVDDGSGSCCCCGDQLERGQVVIRDDLGRRHEDCNEEGR